MAATEAAVVLDQALDVERDLVDCLLNLEAPAVVGSGAAAVVMEAVAVKEVAVEEDTEEAAVVAMVAVADPDLEVVTAAALEI